MNGDGAAGSVGAGTVASGSATGSASSSMTRWRLAEELFHRAAEVPDSEREALVRALAGADEAMAMEVLALLAADSLIEGRMAAGRDGSCGGHGREREDDAAEALVGAQMGNYRLDRVLGRGGMGVVYLAHPESSPGVKVAVKVVRRMLRSFPSSGSLGSSGSFGSSPATRQFLLERDALARLEHPNIARLLDGGVTPEGMPYLVMEYVEGRRLDVFCDDPGVPAEQVVGLFLQLCDAVSYVHRNLILHRDLKPGNVMVTEGGEVKLLDFGTLKSMAPASGSSALTEAGMRPLTLRYASPEHLRGELNSTASEVYSLGVVLYRLLSGRTPLGNADQPTEVYLEWLRTDTPPPPSKVAEGARSKPTGRALASDLDAIVLKCLRFEPGARYPTADALGEDLRRAVTGRAVAAREGALLYRVGKVYGRNRARVWMVAAGAVVVLLGLLATRWEASAARADRLRAERGVQQERRLAHVLLFDYFERLKEVPASTDAQRRAVTVALGYLDDLNRDATAHDEELELDRAGGYTRMARVLGDPYEENLGDGPQALQVLGKARSTTGALLKRNPHDLAALVADSMVLQTMGHIYLGAGDPVRSLAVLRPAAEEGLRIAHDPEVNSTQLAQAASLSEAYGDLLGGDYTAAAGTREEAETRYREALLEYRRGLGMDASCLRCRRGIAIELMKLAIQNEELDGARAIDLYRQSLRTLDSLSAEDRQSARSRRIENIVQQRLSMVQARSDHSPDAIAQLVASRDVMVRSLAQDPIDLRARHDLASLERNLADSYRIPARRALREASLAASIANFQELLREQPGNSEWQFELAQTQLDLSQERAQERAARRGGGPALLPEELAATADLVRLARAPDAGAVVLQSAADALDATHGDRAQELQFAQGSVEISMPHPKFSQWLTLGTALLHAGRAREAAELARRLLAELSGLPRSQEVQTLEMQARGLLAASFPAGSAKVQPGTVAKGP